MVVEVLTAGLIGACQAVGKLPSCHPMAEEDTGPGVGAVEIAGAVQVDRWVWAP
jgi:hypothetical protein